MNKLEVKKRGALSADKGASAAHGASGVLSAYDYGAMLFHWLIALLIIIQLVMGYSMQHIEAIAEPSRFLMMQWHKTFGLLVLILTLARIFWRFANPPPPHAPMAAIELITARIVGFLFYALMLLVPLTGWWLVSVSPLDIATLFFTIPGLEWPHLPLSSSEAAAHLASLSHMILSYGFLLLLFLHVGGALKHVVIDHVPEMARILPGNKMPRKASTPSSRRIAWGLVLGVSILGLAMGQISHLFDRNQESAPLEKRTVLESPSSTWLIDYEKSHLQFRAEFSGEMKQGLIPNWQAQVTFDPEHLDMAQAQILIDAGGMTYDDPYVAGSIPGADGLDVVNHPQITVRLDNFFQIETGYRAKGTVNIKGISAMVEVDFTYDKTGNQAQVNGKAQIDRLAFDIGAKTDGNARYLGRDIYIDFSLQASQP